MEWIRREQEEARNNAAVPIVDYAGSSWFQLAAAAKLGDGQAAAEMERRHR